MHAITRKLRHRRQVREFNRVLNTASPAMRQELIALATREQTPHFL
jgi:hypothetical protein